jgi:hypothetical protein
MDVAIFSRLFVRSRQHGTKLGQLWAELGKVYCCTRTFARASQKTSLPEFYVTSGIHLQIVRHRNEDGSNLK